MKNFTVFSRATWRKVLGTLAVSLLVYTWNAEATAPRIAPQLFGEEKKVDILAYRLSPSETAVQAEDELLIKIVKEAFKAAGKTPTLDIQPSRQLAKYALFNNDAAALIGSPRDFSNKEKTRYHLVTFYLRGGSSAGAEVCLIFSKTHASGEELYRNFSSGLESLIKSGRYQDILETFHGKGKIPADYVDSLNRHNPARK